MPRLKLDPFSPSGVSVVVDAPLLRQPSPGYVVNKATGLIAAGTNVSFTGNGTSDNPYVISSTGGAGGTVSDATTTAKGIIQLAGDLAGTAAAPTVPGLAAKASLTGVETLTNKTLNNTTTVQIKAASLTVQDATDTTKQAKFDASAITTGTTRTYILPNVAGTLALTSSNITGTAAGLSANIAESQVTNLTTDLASKQSTLTLTTTGTSGAATLTGATLNIPQYAGGSGSGITRSISTITTAVTAGATTSTDYVVLINTGGTLTMPTAVGNTNLYKVKNISVANTTVASTSAQTFDGGTLTLSPSSSVDLISDGANWRIF